MSKILRMPRRGSPISDKEKAVPNAFNQNSEHIMHYPRIRRGSHFADFMRDKRLYPEVYHCIIQRDGSSEILSWSQHPSLETAMKNAEVDLTLLAGSEAARA